MKYWQGLSLCLIGIILLMAGTIYWEYRISLTKPDIKVEVLEERTYDVEKETEDAYGIENWDYIVLVPKDGSWVEHPAYKYRKFRLKEDL